MRISKILFLILIILSLIFSMLSCRLDPNWDNNADRQDTGQSAEEAINATLTSAANEFQQWLNAQETPEP